MNHLCVYPARSLYHKLRGLVVIIVHIVEYHSMWMEILQEIDQQVVTGLCIQLPMRLPMVWLKSASNVFNAVKFIVIKLCLMTIWWYWMRKLQSIRLSWNVIILNRWKMSLLRTRNGKGEPLGGRFIQIIHQS